MNRNTFLEFFNPNMANLTNLLNFTIIVCQPSSFIFPVAYLLIPDS